MKKIKVPAKVKRNDFDKLTNWFTQADAETEAEALAMVQAGEGFQESFTDTEGEGDYELYDTEDIS